MYNSWGRNTFLSCYVAVILESITFRKYVSTNDSIHCKTVRKRLRELTCEKKFINSIIKFLKRFRPIRKREIAKNRNFNTNRSDNFLFFNFFILCDFHGCWIHATTWSLNEDWRVSFAVQIPHLYLQTMPKLALLDFRSKRRPDATFRHCLADYQ